MLSETRLLKDYEREVNMRLPDFLDINSIRIDQSGILTKTKHFYQWKDILATAIKTHTIYEAEENEYHKYLLICLADGTILDLPLGDVDYLHNQLGHFIEQYKLLDSNSS